MNIVSGSRCRTDGDGKNAKTRNEEPVVPIRITQTPRCLYPVGIAVYRIPTAKIRSNPTGARQDYPSESITALAESIRRYGVIQPLTVREWERGSYELICGERRLRAVRLLGLSTVNCVVICADRKQSDVLSLCENMQRTPLHYLDEAEAIGALCVRYGLSPEEAAERICCSRPYIRQMMELLTYSREERQMLRRSRLTESQARQLLRVTDADARRALLDRVIENELDAAATEQLVALYLKKRNRKKRPGTFLIRDVRIFYNTLDHAVETMRRAGFTIRVDRCDREDGTYITIAVPKRADQA